MIAWQKYLYIALGLLAYSGAVFFSGIQYDKAQVAKVTVKQLVADQKSDAVIEDRSNARDQKRDTILKTVQAKQPVWNAEPLPVDALTGLRDAGIPTRP